MDEASSSPFKLARAARGVFQHVGHAGHRLQGGHQRCQQRIGPSGVGLDHAGIAKTVNDDARQAIGLGVDQTVIGLIVKLVAQGKGAIEACLEPCLIHLRLGVLVDHPGDDLGIRIDRDQPHGLAVGVFQQRQRAGGKPPRAAVGDQFIGIDPRKAVADGAGIGLGQ